MLAPAPLALPGRGCFVSRPGCAQVTEPALACGELGAPTSHSPLYDLTGRLCSSMYCPMMLLGAVVMKRLEGVILPAISAGSHVVCHVDCSIECSFLCDAVLLLRWLVPRRCRPRLVSPGTAHEVRGMADRHESCKHGCMVVLVGRSRETSRDWCRQVVETSVGSCV